MPNLHELLVQGDQAGVCQYVEDLLKKEINPEEIARGHLVPAVLTLGEMFTRHEIFIPEMLLAARAVNAGLALIKERRSGTHKSRGRVVIGTVKGDLHDIGKNIVVLMLQGSGFEVKDLGVDVPAEKFVNAAKEFETDILALSALLTNTMTEMKNVIQAMDQQGLRPTMKVVVGGAPVTEGFARSIDADGYGPDAFQAIDLISRLVRRN